MTGRTWAGSLPFTFYPFLDHGSLASYAFPSSIFLSSQNKHIGLSHKGFANHDMIDFLMSQGKPF